MEQLIEFLKTVYKCDWYLTKDFLLVECEIITGKYIKTIDTFVEIKYIKPFDEMHVFCFNNSGIEMKKESYMKIVSNAENLISGSINEKLLV